jgi:hypothetical protein
VSSFPSHGVPVAGMLNACTKQQTHHSLQLGSARQRITGRRRNVTPPIRQHMRLTALALPVFELLRRARIGPGQHVALSQGQPW